MKLRSPILTGTDSSIGNEMQRQVAGNITARYDEAQRKKRRQERIRKLKSIGAIVFFCVVIGFGWHLWKTGLFDEYLPATATSGLLVPDMSDALTHGSVLPEGNESQDVKVPIDESVNSTTGDERGRLVDQYSEFERAFRSVAPVYWKDASDADRPAKVGHTLVFRCVAPNRNGDPVFMEIMMPPKGVMSVRRLTVSAGIVKMTKKDFDTLTADTPYLVEREGRVYFATPNGWRKTLQPVPVTPLLRSYNPSRLEFGRLYDLIEKNNMVKPTFSYDVFFDMNGSRNSIKIATVKYGEEVTRALISQKVAEQHSLDAEDAAFMTSVMASGSLRFSLAQ